MRLGKAKPEPERGRSRPGDASAVRRPTFSYYQNRTPNTPQGATNAPRMSAQTIADRKDRPRAPRGPLLSRIPYLLVLALALLCVGRVLLLNATPKVVVVKQTNQTAVQDSYIQKSHIYQAAAAKLLQSSAANRVKPAVNTAAIAASLEKQFPELQSVSVGLPLIGSTPVVYVVPAQPSVILTSAGGAYGVNQNGIVLAKIPGVPTGMTQIDDKSGVSPKVGQQVLPGSTVAFAEAVAYQFKAAKQNVQLLSLPASSAYELDVQLAGKPYMIRFNLEEDARVQSGAALATIAKLGSITPGQYIDVRVPDRVYYK